MDSTAMTMAPTSTMSGMMPTSTTGTPSMGGMGDMDMSCKISTLAQKSSSSMPRDIDIVPGTVKHVLALPTPPGEISTEEQGSSLGTNKSVVGEPSQSPAHDAVEFGLYRPSFVEQIIRALLHTMQFAVAYFIMLLAMYYNGYIIICIFIGAYIGSFIFSWEALSLAKP
ncbi:uncharacterized protein N7483_000172 [Penicillium malachiteum]|uniref:uncharacterized protein n=1 Tax=Penicillium malachiteum TaxID=1324776 RepID=UPI0025474209|nr:uncharacterized protein N7483_000172 [Penicillium malachiteum]KAJ5735047.1 hypothetical protein N7483_000172 [Penicillium malachiteum]